MPRYSVQIPVAGSIIVTVDAETEEFAIAVAMSKADFRVVVPDDDAEPCDFDTFRRLAYGNVFSGPCAEINVEEV